MNKMALTGTQSGGPLLPVMPPLCDQTGRQLFFVVVFSTFWPCPVACGTLVPRPGIEPAPPAVESRNLNHWTTREVPRQLFLHSDLSCGMRDLVP